MQREHALMDHSFFPRRLLQKSALVASTEGASVETWEFGVKRWKFSYAFCIPVPLSHVQYKDREERTEAQQGIKKECFLWSALLWREYGRRNQFSSTDDLRVLPKVLGFTSLFYSKSYCRCAKRTRSWHSRLSRHSNKTTRESSAEGEWKIWNLDNRAWSKSFKITVKLQSTQGCANRGPWRVVVFSRASRQQ